MLWSRVDVDVDGGRGGGGGEVGTSLLTAERALGRAYSEETWSVLWSNCFRGDWAVERRAARLRSRSWQDAPLPVDTRMECKEVGGNLQVEGKESKAPLKNFVMRHVGS